MLRPILIASAATAALSLSACGGGSAAAAVPPLPSTPKGLENAKLVIPADNPLTAEKAHLGKQLFFDKRLSSNGEMSCQTCHLHEYGWSNNERFSTKVDGKQNTRNSPTMYNVGYQPYYYWDGRAPTMEANVMAAWKGHMGGDPEAMAKKLAGIDGYKKQFDAAFEDGVTGDNIVKALTSFVRTLRSGNSKYDRGAMNETEKQGFAAFMKRCAACHNHGMGLFTDFAFRNVGIGTDQETPDIGRGKIDKNLMGAFKTPSLRSVAKTAPYFHDGSVADLREAVKLMASGGIANPNLDPTLKALTDALGAPTDEEIDQLVAFLKALTSEEKFTPPSLPE